MENGACEHNVVGNGDVLVAEYSVLAAAASVTASSIWSMKVPIGWLGSNDFFICLSFSARSAGLSCPYVVYRWIGSCLVVTLAKLVIQWLKVCRYIRLMAPMSCCLSALSVA